MLGLGLDGQPVAVPAEAALHAALHGPVAGDDVLDGAGQQVAVMGQAGGEGRAVVEDELVAAVLAGRVLLHQAGKVRSAAQKSSTSRSSWGNDGWAGTVG